MPVFISLLVTMIGTQATADCYDSELSSVCGLAVVFV